MGHKPHSLSGKSVLVTGAGGFLGSHLAERLVQTGARVTAVVHYNARGSLGWLDRSDLLEDMNIIAGDVCDPAICDQTVKDTDIVYHLAALTTVPFSYTSPASFIRNNIEGTMQMLEAARRLGVERFVQASSSQTYGTAQTVPIFEDHPLKAQSPYAASKIACDALVTGWEQTYGIPSVILKVFCTYGPRQSVRNVVPSIIMQVLSGDVVHLGNLHPRRDFNFVDDAIDAYIRAGSSPEAVGKTLNICGKSEISIEALAMLIGKITKRDIIIEVDPSKVRPAFSEVDRLLGDSSEAERILGWKHNVDLEAGLTKTIEWYRENRSAVSPAKTGVFV